MTCAVFTDVLVDLAREIPMEVAIRASALAHAATCRECGDRLAEQRMLSADLVALTAADEDQHVPDWIETSLRARLRAESGFGAQRRIHFGEHAARFTGAAYQPASYGLRERRDSLPTRTRGVQGGATQHPPAQSTTSHWTWTSVTAAAALLAVVSLLTAERGSAKRPRVPAQTASASPASGDGSFLPLSYGDSLADLDAVQVVHVEVQPTALASLGWTLGAESDGPVEADLLVGQDGVARGIRFVD